MIELSVESVRINQKTQQRVMVLQVPGQERYLFIWIAHAEAYAIAAHLQGTRSPRPLTHDLMKNLVDATGARVLRVVISDLIENSAVYGGDAGGKIFFSEVVLDVASTEVKIDARPSDAVALALRTGSPIFVSEHVLDQAGIQHWPPSPSETEPEKTEQAPPSVDTEE